MADDHKSVQTCAISFAHILFFLLRRTLARPLSPNPIPTPAKLLHPLTNSAPWSLFLSEMRPLVSLFLPCLQTLASPLHFGRPTGEPTHWTAPMCDRPEACSKIFRVAFDIHTEMRCETQGERRTNPKIHYFQLNWNLKGIPLRATWYYIYCKREKQHGSSASRPPNVHSTARLFSVSPAALGVSPSAPDTMPVVPTEETRTTVGSHRLRPGCERACGRIWAGRG